MSAVLHMALPAWFHNLQLNHHWRGCWRCEQRFCVSVSVLVVAMKLMMAVTRSPLFVRVLVTRAFSALLIMSGVVLVLVQC